jgi:hypothetical protein
LRFVGLDGTLLNTYFNLKKGLRMDAKSAKQFLPLVKALAEGKTIQEQLSKEGKWVDLFEHVSFDMDPEFYRVKPDLRWFHVAEFKSRRLFLATTSSEEIELEDDTGFWRWVTGRVEFQ